MYQMIKTQGIRRFSLQEMPSAVAALVVAELFYKLHSFVLECAAFLTTWYLLSLGADLVHRLVARARDGARRT